MYRCKECGAEYEEKPDYCDCGNDEFEETAVNDSGVNTEQTSGYNVTELPQEKAEEQPKAQPASSMNFNNYNYSSYETKRTVSADPYALIIFGVCILLSLYVVFFAWNPKEIGDTVDIKQEPVAAHNIPSIDKIWNNAAPVVKKEDPKNEEKVENIIKQIISVPTQKKQESSKTTTIQKQKVTTVPLKKTTQATAKTTTAKPASTVKQQTNPTAAEQAKKAAEAAAKQKAEQELKAAEAAQLKKLQAEQAKKAAEEKAKQTAAAKQEYINYKIKLRNTIGRKIDFTRVIGDGSCTVSFRIDANGKLVNRSFTKQSSNNTLNDAVYAAVMATPAFNPPPSAYNNEVLNLNISFNNGNFEISLP